MGKKTKKRSRVGSRYQPHITNNAIFKRMMRNPKICSGVISRILGVQIQVSDITYLETEHEGLDDIDAREVRFDCYSIMSNGSIYDVEMQASQELALLKRMRVYQSIIDREAFRRWDPADDPRYKYQNVQDTVIIFICMENPFPKHPRQLLREITPFCITDLTLDCDSGTRWIVVDAKLYGDSKDKDLANLLELFATNKTKKGDELTELIEREVSRFTCGNEGRMLLDTQTESFNDGYEQRAAEDEVLIKEAAKAGKAEGKAKGEAKMAELVKQLLADGRTEDLAKAANDPESRKRLMAEYGIE